MLVLYGTYYSRIIYCGSDFDTTVWSDLDYKLNTLF